MRKRFTQALRVLLGKPLYALSIDGGTMLPDDPKRSEFDYAKTPPFDLAFPGTVANAPPEKIFLEEGLRVCVFPSRGERCRDCGHRLHWLTVELSDGDGEWYHLVTMHETRIAVILAAFEDVIAYLRDQE